MDYIVKIKENEKIDKFWDLARELKKLWNMTVTTIIIEIGALGTIPNGILWGLEELEIGGWAKNKPNYSIVEIDQNTEVVSQTPVWDHQLTRDIRNT